MRALTAGLFAAMFLLVSHMTGTVHAYLDPGTGSMLLQTLLAAVVGIVAVGRLYWHRLKSFLLRRDIKENASLDE